MRTTTLLSAIFALVGVVTFSIQHSQADYDWDFSGELPADKFLLERTQYEVPNTGALDSRKANT